MSRRNSTVARGRDIEETTPLLSNGGRKHELIYERFTARQKRVILGLVSFYGIMPLFIAGTFIPCIPQISRDLKTTPSVISMAVSVFIFTISVSALAASSYSTYYGRRPVYLYFMPLLILGSVGTGLSHTVMELSIWRGIQAIGTSPAFAVGAGVIGDIYKLEERGTAMGVFFAFVIMGPALAPFMGGLAAHYSDWRVMQYAIAVVGCVIYASLYAGLPETSHPGERGIDKAQVRSGEQGLAQVSTWRSYFPIILNPFGPLAIMKSPNLLLVCLAGLFSIITDYVLLVPIAYTIGERYGIKNEMVIGACFLPAAIGNTIGASLSGRLSDSYIVHYKEKRGGVWYPEDRLRATLVPAGVLVPMSIWLSGIVTTYVEDRTLGLTLNLICLFINGVGVDAVFSPSASYFVDVMHSRSAESMAANNAFRSMLTALFVAGIMPMIETYGVLFTDALSGAVSLLTFLFLLLTIRYGEEMRRWGGICEVKTTGI